MITLDERLASAAQKEGFTVIESACVAAPVLLVAFTVKLLAPAVVGVPPMAPVEELSDSPAGSEPAARLQVTAVDAVTVWE